MQQQIGMVFAIYVLLREHKLVSEIHRCFVLFFFHRKEALKISTMDYFTQTNAVLSQEKIASILSCQYKRMIPVYY